MRAIVQQGAQSPFASAILRYHRRVLIDQVAWDACLARLSQPKTNMSIKGVGDAKEMSRKIKMQPGGAQHS